MLNKCLLIDWLLEVLVSCFHIIKHSLTQAGHSWDNPPNPGHSEETVMWVLSESPKSESIVKKPFTKLRKHNFTVLPAYLSITLLSPLHFFFFPIFLNFSMSLLIDYFSFTPASLVFLAVLLFFLFLFLPVSIKHIHFTCPPCSPSCFHRCKSPIPLAVIKIYFILWNLQCIKKS